MRDAFWDKKDFEAVKLTLERIKAAAADHIIYMEHMRDFHHSENGLCLSRKFSERNFRVLNIKICDICYSMSK